MEPLYKHDCDRCIFLGNEEVDGEAGLDWYICPGDAPTLICRFGDDGPNYSSYPFFEVFLPIFNEGLEMKRRG
jgi:hypothetical protein